MRKCYYPRGRYQSAEEMDADLERVARDTAHAFHQAAGALDHAALEIVVAVRDPYDIAYFTAASTYVATYSYSPVAVEAVARVITGDIAPTGKLPVDIPVAGEPDTVLYPFGHGLTF